MFLTSTELRDLTGYKHRSAQMRWLTSQGFRFVVNGLGLPIVAVAEMERKLVGGPPRAQQRPNWAALDDRPRPQLRLPAPKAKARK